MGAGKAIIMALLAIAIVAWGVRPAAAAAPRVVVSIAPLHSLVAGVMAGVGRPHLLVAGGASPHDYTLRPSDARALAAADIVFRVGPGADGILDRPLAALAGRARVIRTIETPGVTVLPARAGGVFAPHDHGGDGARSPDPHLWLEPANAAAIVAEAVAVLAAHDPARAATYRANGARSAARLAALRGELAAIVRPVAGTPFVVFHDAYQYFERAFGLAARGALTLATDRQPGVRRVAALRAAIVAGKAVCVFAEPQFPPALVATITAGTTARAGTLDPLGAALPPGPEHYFMLLRGLATALVDCLSGPPR